MRATEQTFKKLNKENIFFVPDRYYFGAEPNDLKNPLCRTCSCSSMESSWISLSSALRG